MGSPPIRSRTRSRWRLRSSPAGARPPVQKPRLGPSSRPPPPNGPLEAPLEATDEGTQDVRPPPSWPRARPDDLAGVADATHVSTMLSQTKTQIVGFMELQVGSLAVQVPIRAAEPTPAMPLASFEVEGESYAILIRGDSSSKAVERAMGQAAKEAVQHLSRKLLN